MRQGDHGRRVRVADREAQLLAGPTDEGARRGVGGALRPYGREHLEQEAVLVRDVRLPPGRSRTTGRRGPSGRRPAGGRSRTRRGSTARRGAPAVPGRGAPCAPVQLQHGRAAEVAAVDRRGLSFRPHHRARERGDPGGLVAGSAAISGGQGAARTSSSSAQARAVSPASNAKRPASPEPRGGVLERGEPPGPLGELGRGRQRPPGERPPRRLVQHRGHRGVRRRRGQGEVTGALLGITGHLGEAGVEATAGSRGELPVRTESRAIRSRTRSLSGSGTKRGSPGGTGRAALGQRPPGLQGGERIAPGRRVEPSEHRPVKERSRSASAGRSARTRKPALRAIRTPASRTVVFPTPASPWTTSAIGSCGGATTRRSAPSSSSLPTTGGERWGRDVRRRTIRCGRGPDRSISLAGRPAGPDGWRPRHPPPVPYAVAPVNVGQRLIVSVNSCGRHAWGLRWR